MKKHSLRFVTGYLANIDYPNPRAFKNHLTHKVSLIFDSDNGEKYSEVFLNFLTALLQNVGYEDIQILLNKSQKPQKISFSEIKKNLTAFDSLLFLKKNVLFLYVELIPYYAFGGAWPYADSYTYSFYAKNSDIEKIKSEILQLSRKLNLEIAEVFSGDAKPKISLWQRMKDWLGR